MLAVELLVVSTFITPVSSLWGSFSIATFRVVTSYLSLPVCTVVSRVLAATPSGIRKTVLLTGTLSARRLSVVSSGSQGPRDFTKWCSRDSVSPLYTTVPSEI